MSKKYALKKSSFKSIEAFLMKLKYYKKVYRFKIFDSEKYLNELKFDIFKHLGMKFQYRN